MESSEFQGDPPTVRGGHSGLLVYPAWANWSRDRRLFRIVTDSQSVALVANGWRPLTSDYLRPVFRRTLRSAHQLVMMGWRPAQHHLVSWKRRSHNQLGDFMAKRTMQWRRNWNQVFCMDALKYPSNLFLFVDGAFSDKGASAAWAVVAVVSEQNPFVLVQAAGEFYEPGCLRSAFEAECLALEQGCMGLCEVARQLPQ